MLRAGLVDSMSCVVVAVFDHASCGSCRQYVMYCCCCLRPCFVRVLSTVCHVVFLLSRDHALCGSCQYNYVMYCCNNVIIFCSIYTKEETEVQVH